MSILGLVVGSVLLFLARRPVDEKDLLRNFLREISRVALTTGGQGEVGQGLG